MKVCFSFKRCFGNSLGWTEGRSICDKKQSYNLINIINIFMMFLIIMYFIANSMDQFNMVCLLFLLELVILFQEAVSYLSMLSIKKSKITFIFKKNQVKEVGSVTPPFALLSLSFCFENFMKMKTFRKQQERSLLA